MKPKVSIRKITEYQLPELRAAVQDFLSGLDSLRLQNAKTVLVKPNLLGNFPPEQAVTTHPVVLEVVIQYLLECGKEVWLGDSPGGAGNVKQVWQTTGMQALADKYPIQLVNFASFGVQEFEADGLQLTISKVAWEADAIISVSKYKTHSLMAYTGALKNLYGLVPGMIKTVYHRQYINTDSFGHMLAELYKIVRHRVVYHIMDGIIGMDGAGPSAGRPRRFGLLFGSASAPALDFLASSYMGFSLKQLGYIKECLHADGIIPSQIEYPVSFNAFRLSKVDNLAAGWSSRIMGFVPPKIRVIADKVFDFHPYITDQCQACLICVKSCPVQTIVVGADGIPYIKPEKCIKCLCCHEMCPHQAIGLHKSWLAKLVLH
jgi:uncharacterized protein (DUF362 family)/Pyruvate/2-oxoacid:ferredoxin oxidoreductase delta subunit